MSSMRHISTGALILGTLLAARGAQAKEDFGLDSRNQPIVTAGGAYVPNCPNWSSSHLDSAALNDYNHGCAINSNLAAMIADPMDLIHGKSDQTTDTENNMRAIKAWREAPATSKVWSTTAKESTKGGGQ
jgi:pilus assembly protein CpaD